MKIIADTNIFLAVVLEEPEKGRIIQLTAGHELAAPMILPYEIGNALIAYDACFLECALRLRCPLLTLDRRMKTVAREIGIQIMEL